MLSFFRHIRWWFSDIHIILFSEVYPWGRHKFYYNSEFHPSISQCQALLNFKETLLSVSPPNYRNIAHLPLRQEIWNKDISWIKSDVLVCTTDLNIIFKVAVSVCRKILKCFLWKTACVLLASWSREQIWQEYDKYGKPDLIPLTVFAWVNLLA